MNVEQMEQRFHALKEQLETGKIDDEQFVTEVEKLQFQDGQGQPWRIGASTGHWYYEEGGRWVRGEPPRESKVPSKATVVALLLAVGVFVLIVAVILVGRWPIPWPKTPTAMGLATDTATPLPTAKPTQTPTDTPSPTATFTQVPPDIPSPTRMATLTLPTPTVTVPLAPIPPEDTPTPAPTPTATPTATITPKLTNTPIPTPMPIVAGKIAFPVFDPERGTYDIFIANADDTGRKKIKEEASQPCLSPDGTEITYRSWRSDKRGLIVAHTFGDDIWTITTRHEASRPSVSRGGTVYHCKEPGRPVHIYLTRGSGEPEVIRWGDQHQPISGESPAWVSGERLVYKGCVGGTCGLYLTDGVYDGTGITQLTYDTSDTNPEASPDGKKVAFMSRRDSNWEIYVMDLDTRKVKRLTNNGADDGLPIWSPDGRTIAFASDRSGEWAIWVMNPDGSNQRMLFALEGSLHGYVRDAPQHERVGWEEERLSWSP